MVILIFILSQHIVSCCWLILATLVKSKENYDGTWIAPYQNEYGGDDLALYCLAFYWSVTTITTVGYGDITGTNNYERVFCSFIMVVGVILFSMANGALASIMTSLDECGVDQHLDLLAEIY